MTAETAPIAPEAQPAARPRLFPLPTETVGEISRQAAQIKLSDLLLSVLGGLLFGVGWVIYKAFALVGRMAVWTFAAARMGYRQAAGIPLNQPDLRQVMAENEWLRREVERLQ